jgi:hypothetical protein
MRISENTAAQLKLQDRTFWITVVCFCAAGVLVVSVATSYRDVGPLVGAALFVICGLGFLRKTDVTFDKVTRICDVTRFDVMRLQRARLTFKDIVDVRVETSPGQADAAVTSCRLSLVTKSSVLPLTASYEPGLERFNTMRDAIVDTVFAHAPRPVAADPIDTLTKTGRIIDAVAALRKREGIGLTEAVTRVKQLRKK